MQITHLKLTSWRNFRDVDVPLQRRAFVIGANAAGKSNLLDSLKFLRAIASPGGGLQKAVRDRGGVSKIRCLAARRYPAITLDVQIGETQDERIWHYRVSIKQDNRRQPQIGEEIVEYRGENILRRPDAADEDDSERLRQTHLEQVNTNKEFRPIADFFRSIRYLHVLPPLVRQPDRLAYTESGQESFGSDFLNQIADTPPRIRQSRLTRITAALRAAVPQLQELKLETDKYGIPHLEGRYEHWRPYPAHQREEQFSDGTLRLMALLWAMMDGSGPLLLEEPELNLHHAVVRYLPLAIYRATRKNDRQIIISTHSRELLSDKGIGANETLLLHPDKDGTRIQLAADSITVLTLLERGWSIADAALPRTSPRDAPQLAFAGI